MPPLYPYACVDLSGFQSFKIVPSMRVPSLAKRLGEQRHILMRMADTHEPLIGGPEMSPPKPASATAIKGGTIYVTLPENLVDVEILRLNKEIKNLEQYIPRVEGKLNLPTETTLWPTRRVVTRHVPASRSASVN